MDTLFNNREIAVGFWLIVFTLYILMQKSIRKSLVDLLKQVFALKIIIPLLLSFLPTTVIVALLAYFDLWDPSVLKETTYWAIGTGLIMFGSFDAVESVRQLYTKTAKDTLVLVVVLEFLVWFYVFALWIEILLVPITTLVVMLATVAKHQKASKTEAARKLFDGLQAFIGLLLLFFASMALVNNPGSLFTTKNLQLFLLPIVLSFAYAPSVYLLALYSKYELVFNRVNNFLKLSKKDKRAIKVAVVKRCGTSVYAAGEMIRHLAVNFDGNTTKSRAIKLVSNFDPKKELSE